MLGVGRLKQTQVNERVISLNSAPVPTNGRYILYWSQVNRRVDSNPALRFAVELANEHDLPVLFYEGLTCQYPFASDRFHTFVLEGVPETARRAQLRGAGYVFHLRRRQSDPNDAVYRLALEAAAVVTDDYPLFPGSVYNTSVASKLQVPFYAVDGSCIVPMAHFSKQEYAAYTIRPKINKLLDQYLQPQSAIRLKRKFGPANALMLSLNTQVVPDKIADLVSSCEVDHSVSPVPTKPGGRSAAEDRLRNFLENNLLRYPRLNREPTAGATSGLSPYLHFGHISALEVALAVRDYAAQHKLMANEFLEELIVRRELAFNFARFSPSVTTLDALADWTRATLAKHDGDRRDYVYSRDQFEAAQTHDPLWNAMQRELLTEGSIHGYYRMYWVKKIMEWSADHAQALANMIYLNDRYALDGRDPNSYTGFLWCLGLHDRPWTERPVFGMIRFMSYDGMRRKTDVDGYIREFEQGRLL